MTNRSPLAWLGSGALIFSSYRAASVTIGTRSGTVVCVASPTTLNGADERDETAAERLDRNTIELLNELRIAGTGIQVIFGFLLIVPFNTGWRRVSPFGHTVYYVTLLCVALSSVLLIAPSVQHRILFRQGEKEYLIETANRLALIGTVFLAVGFTGILVLVSDVVANGVGAVIVGAVAAIGIGVLWFGVPLARLRAQRENQGPTASGEKASPHRGGAPPAG
jgi:uncharacterized protein DUF6328